MENQKTPKEILSDLRDMRVKLNHVKHEVERMKPMKKYSYTVNNPLTTGTYTIEVSSKEEAIEKANKLWKYSGVNVSSFRQVK